jgi:hypothetical protein
MLDGRMVDVAFEGPATRDARIGVALGAAVLALHAYSLLLPFVNQESAFNQAATYFREGGSENINAFFAAEANSVVVSALGAALSLVFQFGPQYGCRVLSLACLAGFVIALHSMLPDQPRRLAVLGLFLIVANPLAWTFAGRGTADFTPMALAVMSIALFWRSRGSSLMVVLAALLFAAASLTKIHVVLLLPLVGLSPEMQSVRRRTALLFIAFAAAVVSLAIYNAAIFRTFGFWLTPPQFAVVHSPTVTNVGNNFVRYGGYLALLAAPFSVALALRCSDRRMVMLKLAAICLGAVLGLALPASAGEMNFGPFDRWIGDWFSGAVLSGFFVILVIGLIAMTNGWIGGGMVLSVVLVLLALSLSRPAQRYLLLILPFYYLMIFRIEGIRRIAVPTLVLFLALNMVVATIQARAAPPNATNVFGPARQF